MTYYITYIDSSGSMISSNNPTSYDYSNDGVITLVAPIINCGEFRGWYTDAGLTTRITQLDSTITEDISIYANININTQLQILGSSIPEISDLSNLSSKYILMSNSISGGSSRSLSAITPANFSSLVSHTTEFIQVTAGSISANLTSVYQEYYIDVNEQDSLTINMVHPENSKYIIIHFTRGDNCTLDNISFYVTISGITIYGSSTNKFFTNVGSTLIFHKQNSIWNASEFFNPQLTDVSNELINNSLNVRNYSYTGTETFSPTGTEDNSGRKYIDVNLSDLDLAQSESSVLYKSIVIQFDNSSYDESGADIATLNRKQGYLNLIDVQATKLTYDTSTESCTLRLTYDYVPSYTSPSLSSFTQNIPIRIMVVI